MFKSMDVDYTLGSILILSCYSAQMVCDIWFCERQKSEWVGIKHGWE